MTLDKQIEIMQAFLDKKRVEEKMLAGGKWHKTTAPTWNWSTYEYRIRQSVEDYADKYKEALVISGKATTAHIITHAYKAGWEQHAKTTKNNH